MPSPPSPTRLQTIIAAFAMIAAWLGVIGTTSTAAAVEFGCRIGKPSYCLKYGQMFCLRENVLPDREQACAEWVQACFDCHRHIPNCLGGTRPPASSPLCKGCEGEWRQCMHAIDAVFWPNRRKKSDDSDETKH